MNWTNWTFSIWTSVASQWIDRFLVPIDDPSSRLFHVNLIMAIVLIVVWYVFQKKASSFSVAFRDISKLVLRKKYWWNRSTRSDYQIYLLNSVFKVLLFIPFLDFSFRISTRTARTLMNLNNGSAMSLESSTLWIFLFSIAYFVFDDFLRFLHHFLMHKIPFLWKLHQVHHSAKILTPITLYRIHPLESAMSTVRNSISAGVSIGVFIFMFESHFSIFTIFGINLFGFLFNVLGSNLRHSHIDFSFGPLEHVFISPKQHQIHHSSNPDHYDKNFGVSLSIWDRLCGSLLVSKEVSSRLRFGLNQRQKNLRNSLGFQ